MINGEELLEKTAEITEDLSERYPESEEIILLAIAYVEHEIKKQLNK